MAVPPDRAAIRAEAARLRAGFEAAGARAVETAILQPAGPLLDLYGEDIRARAFTTSDPSGGEQMLRPDFTVPVALAHLEAGAGPARLTYAGEVFRRQDTDPARPGEYVQVGLEIFGAAGTGDPGTAADADAEVFAAIAGALAPLDLRASIGDIGVLRAAVDGLPLSPDRRAALLRHLWRPRRFRALLERFAGRTSPGPDRQALLERHRAGEDVLAGAGRVLGARRPEEVRARLDRLAADLAQPPLPASDLGLLERLLGLRDAAPAALERLRDMAVDLPSLAAAAARLEARLAALERHGVDVAALEFEASYGRTTLEYYDGFVFGFAAPGRPDQPPVATGGRYDALMRLLGGAGTPIAVGGVIRPEVVLSLGTSPLAKEAMGAGRAAPHQAGARAGDSHRGFADEAHAAGTLPAPRGAAVDATGLRGAVGSGLASAPAGGAGSQAHIAARRATHPSPMSISATETPAPRLSPYAGPEAGDDRTDAASPAPIAAADAGRHLPPPPDADEVGVGSRANPSAARSPGAEMAGGAGAAP